jgi:hypothetical protein
MSRKSSFWWGFFGCVLPEIVRFFVIIAHGQALPHLNWPLYLGLLLLYAVCGGLFSVGWKPENEFKAIWVGASLPALVAALVNVAPTHT